MKIVSIGEILYDVYSHKKVIGGAPFNFIHHIKKLTGEGDFISRVGNDEDGKEILNYLKSAGFDTNLVRVDKEHPTGKVTVNLNDEKVPTFNIHENAAYDFIAFDRSIEDLLNRGIDLLYFGTLAQREKVSRHTIKNLWNRKFKYFCDLNLRQNYYSEDLIFNCINNTNVLKVNEDELKIINDLFIKDYFDLIGTSEKIIEKFPIELLAVTLGSNGAHLFKGNEKVYHKNEVEDIVDTVGAGDAFAAILCLGYLNDWDLETTSRLAGHFSAAICKVNGAIPADKYLYEKFKNLMEQKNE